MMGEHHNEQVLTQTSSLFIRVLLTFIFLLLLFTVILLPSERMQAEYSSKSLNQPLQGINDVFLPIIFRNHNLLPLETPTATATPTNTPTLTGTPPTSTPTLTGTPATSTPTATSTATGTPPTPTWTATGTVTANPRLSMTVSPFQANVGNQFTFSIEVTNIGTAPANDAILTDSFPDFVDVLSVSTSKGTPGRAIHSASVIIGTVIPGERVSVTIIVRANSRKLTSETVVNTITLDYDGGVRTTSVSYRIIVTTLPGTGELPLDWDKSSRDWVLTIQGLLIGGLGIILCGLGIWAWGRKSKEKTWLIGIGFVLLIVSAFTLYTDMQNRYTTDISSRQLPNPDGFESDPNRAQDTPSATPSLSAHLPAYLFATPADIAIETLPSYPIPSPEITITPGPNIQEPDISAVNRIIIPAISLDTEVKFVPFDGMSWLIRGLRYEVAWLGDTSWPGLGGNTVLAGHVTVSGIGNGPFRGLEELGDGEFVILHTEENTYTYRVRGRKIVEDWDLSVTEPSDEPQLTLITCVEWDEEQETYLKRLILFADLVRVDPLLRGSSY